MRSATRKIFLALGLVFSLVPFCVAMIGFNRFLDVLGYSSPIWVILMVPALMFEALLHFGGILYSIQFWQTAQYPKSIAISCILAGLNLVWMAGGALLMISPDAIADFWNYEKLYENEFNYSGENIEEDMYAEMPDFQHRMPPNQPGYPNSGFGANPGTQPGVGAGGFSDDTLDSPLADAAESDFSFSDLPPTPSSTIFAPSGTLPSELDPLE